MSTDGEDAERRRLRWQCRRGMLELDLLLNDFVERGYADLDAAGQQVFERLLGHPDQILHGWLMQQAVPADSELRDLVGRILKLAGSSPSQVPN